MAGKRSTNPISSTLISSFLIFRSPVWMGLQAARELNRTQPGVLLLMFTNAKNSTLDKEATRQVVRL